LHYRGKYLPDFYIPKYSTFIELKPMPSGNKPRLPQYFNKDATKKARELSIVTEKTVILVFGDPLEHRACWFEDGEIEIPDSALAFSYDECITPTFYELQELKVPYPTGEQVHILNYEAHRREAIIARQARFEYSENPDIKSGQVR